MNLARSLSHLLLSLYGTINRSGLLNHGWPQALFVRSYFGYKQYLEDSTAKLTKKLPALFEGGHILDIGANIGYTAYVFSKSLSPSYKIFAFEPEKRNLSILKKVARTYQFSNKVFITAAAVGDRVGEIELWQNDDHHADHRILTEELRAQLKGQIQIQKIPVTTIDHFLESQAAAQPISFIKIDVQGYELAVCRGMEATLAANPKTTILFEYCPEIINALGYRAEELIEFFQDRNYSFYRLNKNGTLTTLSPENLKQDKTSKDYYDVLCSHNERLAQAQVSL